MKQDETKALDREIGDYVAENTKVIWVDNHTMQIATMMIDSYGDTVYVWVEEAENHCRVSDGGRILFKLDPNSEDKELNETAKKLRSAQVISLTTITLKSMSMLTVRTLHKLQ